MTTTGFSSFLTKFRTCGGLAVAAGLYRCGRQNRSATKRLIWGFRARQDESLLRFSFCVGRWLDLRRTSPVRLNLALRQQLAVFKRTTRGLPSRQIDFWLSEPLGGLADALIVLRRHRGALHRQWAVSGARRSMPTRVGRPAHTAIDDRRPDERVESLWGARASRGWVLGVESHEQRIGSCATSSPARTRLFVWSLGHIVGTLPSRIAEHPRRLDGPETRRGVSEKLRHALALEGSRRNLWRPLPRRSAGWAAVKSYGPSSPEGRTTSHTAPTV